MAAYQYIYVMKDLTKTYPGGREVLKDITLSFLPGAKIGVLGPQRRRQVDAAADHGRRRAGLCRRGLGGRGRHGRLPAAGAAARSRARTCCGNVMEGARRDQGAARPFRRGQRALRRADADAEMDALLAEQAELQEKIDAGNGWELDRTVEIAMDALRCPPGDADVDHAVGRRAAAGGAVPAAAAAARPAAARRADQPSRRRDRWPGSSASSKDYTGTVVAVTHDRYFLDNVAGWILELDRGRGIPYEGNYSALARAEAAAAGAGGAPGGGAPAHARSASWSGSAEPAGAPGQEQGAHLGLRGPAGAEPRDRRRRPAQIVIPPGPRLGDLVIEAEHVQQGLRRPAADRGPRLQAAARRHRRRHRPERRRQDHAVPHDHRRRSSPTAAASGSARPSSSAMSTRAATRSSADKTVWRGDLRRAGRDRARQAHGAEPRLLSRRSTSRAPTSRRRSASSRAASATASTWPRC